MGYLLVLKIKSLSCFFEKIFFPTFFFVCLYQIFSILFNLDVSLTSYIYLTLFFFGLLIIFLNFYILKVFNYMPRNIILILILILILLFYYSYFLLFWTFQYPPISQLTKEYTLNIWNIYKLVFHTMSHSRRVRMHNMSTFFHINSFIFN